MATIRIPEKIWETTRAHLFKLAGEHFAFFLADWTYSLGEPVFLVQDAILVPDSEVVCGIAGMELSLASILAAVNAAIRERACLVEIHNHNGAKPRFSLTDRVNLPEFVDYVDSSLPDRPYAATVWGDTAIYGEYFVPDGRTGAVNSVTVVGSRLRQVVSRDDERFGNLDARFARQLPWFTGDGQQQLERLRIGIVGCGGTGSVLVQSLAYLGCRDFLLIDHDHVEESNLNRVVTAGIADVESPKVMLGRRLVKNVAPEATVIALELDLRDPRALDALRGVDVVFGCVDNDGARLIMNELALAYSIPYIDLAVGIEANSGVVQAAGGRVAVVLPGGPCLHCMGQIDVAEAAYYFSPPEERKRSLAMGYVSGVEVPSPAVVSINTQIAASAANEFAVLVSGLRPVRVFTDFDLLGAGRKTKGQWISPVTHKKAPHCLQCVIAGQGDEAGIEMRYAWSNNDSRAPVSQTPSV